MSYRQSFLIAGLLIVVVLALSLCYQSDPNKPKTQFRKLTAEELKQSTACVQKLYPEYEKGSLIGQTANRFRDCFAQPRRIDRYPTKTVYYLEFHGEVPPTIESAGAMIITVDEETGKLSCVEIVQAEF